MFKCDICTKRIWLELLLRDKDENLSFIETGMSRDAANDTMYDICHYYRLSFGVPRNTRRIFEQYVASLEARLTWYSGTEYAGLVGPQLRFIIACCFHLAAKSSITASRISLRSIHKYLLSRNVYQYTIPRIRVMEKKIFKHIGYRLPLYSCVDMAGMLAVEMEVPVPTIKLVIALVKCSEARRKYIDYGVRLLVDQRHILTHDDGVKTFHIAAACVIAATQCDFGLSEAMRMAERLHKYLFISKAYLRTLSSVILAETSILPTNYLNWYGLDNAYEDVL